MKPIKMVDLQGQMQNIRRQINASFDEILDQTAFIQGPQVKKLEADLSHYLGVKHTIGCANGTDALQIALMALELKPGDEVITSDFTFAATAEVIALLGLTPVLVDVDETTFCLDIEKIKAVITPRTKAIIPVHLFGQSANMEPLMQIAQENQLFVIEDHAQSMGASYRFLDGTVKKCGAMGHISTTSFFPSKNLGAYGDGGALFTNDDQLAHTLRGIADHGMYRRYYHDKVGVNSRLDTLQAAVLLAKLPHLDAYNARRQQAAEIYNRLFQYPPSIKTPKIAPYSTHVFHQYTLVFENHELREAVRQRLTDRQIPHAIYYPVPLHRQKAFSSLMAYRENDFPVSNQLVDCVLSLPMHTELDQEQQTYIAQAVLERV